MNLLPAIATLLVLPMVGVGFWVVWKMGQAGTTVPPLDQGGAPIEALSAQPVMPASGPVGPTAQPAVAELAPATAPDPVPLRAGSDGWSDYDLDGVRLSVPGRLQSDANPGLVGHPPEAEEVVSYHSVFGGVRIRIATTRFTPPPTAALLDELLEGFEKEMRGDSVNAEPRIGRATFDFRGNPAQRIWTRFGDTSAYADVWHVINGRDLVTVGITGPEKEAREVSEMLMRSLDF